LARPEEKPNCEIEETRNFYKKAYEIFTNVVSGNATVVSLEEINILEKLANPTTSHYNTRIEKLVKLLKERTNALTELFSAINSYNPIGDANLPNVAAKIATIKNMNFNAFIVSDATKQAATDILSKRRKMDRLTVKIPYYDIKGVLNRIISNRK
jgi:phosphopantetheine adenylyltransferase